MSDPDSHMESTGSEEEIERSPIVNLLKELWTASESERNNGVSKWVTAATTDHANLALLMAKDLLENLKQVEDAATPLVIMDVNFSWGMIKKYLTILLTFITVSGKEETSEDDSQVLDVVTCEVNRHIGKAKPQKKAQRKGDWFCFACKFHNFAKRGACKECLAFRSERGFPKRQKGMCVKGCGVSCKLSRKGGKKVFKNNLFDNQNGGGDNPGGGEGEDENRDRNRGGYGGDNQCGGGRGGHGGYTHNGFGGGTQRAFHEGGSGYGGGGWDGGPRFDGYGTNSRLLGCDAGTTGGFGVVLPKPVDGEYDGGVNANHG